MTDDHTKPQKQSKENRENWDAAKKFEIILQKSLILTSENYSNINLKNEYSSDLQI